MFSAPDWEDGQLKTQFKYLPETSTVYSTKELPYKSPCSDPRATLSGRRGVEESPEVLPTRASYLEADESRKATDIVPRTGNTRRLKYHVKSKNGCRTCRFRRVKCDETKPECKRCETAGWDCKGYPPPKQMLKDLPNKTIVQLLPMPGDITYPPNQLFGSDHDRRCFDFFRVRTVYMVPSHFDVEFWTYFLLQISQSERTVWHAALALSILHEERLHGRNIKDKTLVEASRRFAIRHYNEAIRRLTSHLYESKDPKGVVLVTCLIFFWLEDMLGNPEASTMHMLSGLNMIRSWRNGKPKITSSLPPSRSNFIEAEIAPMFDALNHHLFIYGAILPPSSDDTNYDDQPETESFGTLRDARLSMVEFRNDIQQFAVKARSPLDLGNVQVARNASPSPEEEGIANDKPDPTIRIDPLKFENQRQALLSRASRWSEALDTLLKQPHMIPLSNKDLRGVCILRIEYAMAYILTSTILSSEETSYDACVTYYSDIVNITEDALEKLIETSLRNKFEAEITSALFTTTVKCRNPTIRRRALALTKRTFSGNMVSNCDFNQYIPKVAERVIEIEEEGLEDLRDGTGEVVPSEWARVKYLNIASYKNKVVSFTRSFSKRRDGVMRSWEEII